ncbi:FKBP-type peptidyl-prolyl cis-trans isomerase [Uliginosibacterium sp. H1]|uniref:FKBP-type peptidyl-prolyl cis-trans isomerase n=1 Tax=Uliginosibacterium sp. H1 TaxID=3114757 RepID=UPI002E1845C0|nr:FKBP-type peptidyl-prolyl cis-trans isomerase [Uliginosibacterium sp. H1]
MKRIAVTAALAVISFSALAAEMTEDQKTLYALGQALARPAGQFTLSPAEQEVVKQGMADGLSGKKPAVDMEVYLPKVQALAMSRRSVIADKAAAEGKAFADKAAKEKGAQKTASGLVYIPIKAGTGATPKAEDKVKVHYTGTLTNGEVFDSSVKRGTPAEFPLNGVIKCWTEGVQKMKVGGKARLVCPADIAYGENGQGPIPPKATLNFEVELIEIVK